MFEEDCPRRTARRERREETSPDGEKRLLIQHVEELLDTRPVNHQLLYLARRKIILGNIKDRQNLDGKQLFEIVTWPDWQYLMEYPDFADHSFRIMDRVGQKQYGCTAFFVENKWMQEITSKRKLFEYDLKRLLDKKEVCIAISDIKFFLSYCKEKGVSVRSGDFVKDFVDETETDGEIVGKIFYTSH